MIARLARPLSVALVAVGLCNTVLLSVDLGQSDRLKPRIEAGGKAVLDRIPTPQAELPAAVVEIHLPNRVPPALVRMGLPRALMEWAMSVASAITRTIQWLAIATH